MKSLAQGHDPLDLHAVTDETPDHHLVGEGVHLQGRVGGHQLLQLGLQGVDVHADLQVPQGGLTAGAPHQQVGGAAFFAQQVQLARADQGHIGHLGVADREPLGWVGQLEQQRFAHRQAHGRGHLHRQGCGFVFGGHGAGGLRGFEGCGLQGGQQGGHDNGTQGQAGRKAEMHGKGPFGQGNAGRFHSADRVKPRMTSVDVAAAVGGIGRGCAATLLRTGGAGL
jgi:hypothetical protein